MIRIVSSSSVCHTMISRCCMERPVVRNRSSPTEWSGSATVVANGSPKTELASSKDALWFARFSAAFAGSHANFMSEVYHVLSGARRGTARAVSALAWTSTWTVTVAQGVALAVGAALLAGIYPGHRGPPAARRPRSCAMTERRLARSSTAKGHADRRHSAAPAWHAPRATVPACSSLPPAAR